MESITIPCVKDKCLKYPICKSRAIIECSPLKEYYMIQIGDAEGKQMLDEIDKLWTIIHKYLPSVSVINSNYTVIQSSVFTPPVLYCNRQGTSK